MEMHKEIMFKVKKDDGREYRLHLPDSCPSGEAHDVLFEMLVQVVKIAEDNLEKLKEAKEKSNEKEDGKESEQK